MAVIYGGTTVGISTLKLASLTIAELKELQDDINETLKRRALEELVFAENRVNELRVLAGMKKRPVSKMPEQKKRRPRLASVK